MNDERHPLFHALVDEIANTPSLLALSQVTAERGEILVGIDCLDFCSVYRR